MKAGDEVRLLDNVYFTPNADDYFHTLFKPGEKVYSIWEVAPFLGANVKVKIDGYEYFFREDELELVNAGK